MQDNKKIFVDYDSPVKLANKCHISLRISNEFGYVNDVKAMFNRNGEKPGGEGKSYLEYDESKSNSEYSTFSGDMLFKTPGYRTFYIELKLNGHLEEIKYDYELESAVIATGKVLDFWELFVSYSDFKTPEWIKGGIMYQIFVDTFCSVNLPEELKNRVVSWGTFPKWQKDNDGIYRNNQFYGGNLRGIIQKVDEGYFDKLGVTVLYLTPVLQSPSSNRYDTLDYEKIDDMVGTWDDLDELHKKLNSRGISLIVDMVFNHSSSGNRLLREDPEMYSWVQKYTIPHCWWGYGHLVEFNKISENYFRNLAEWLSLYSKYMDGIRLDVADNLPDFVLKFIRNHFGKYILGEVWKNAVTGEFREFLYGDELDAVMNYQFPNAIYRYVRWGNYKYFKAIVERICKLYPEQALSASPIFLSSHDIPRIPNILVGDFMKESTDFENVWDMEKDGYWFNGGSFFDTDKFRRWEVDNDRIPADKRELAYQLQGLAVFFQYTLPGLPSIFAGDEAGVTGFKDPTNRKPFPWNNIDKRSFELYQRLGAFRTKYRDVFSGADFKILQIDNCKTIYRRGNLTFILNRTPNEVFVENYNLQKAVFSLKEVTSEHVVAPYNAVVIKD